MADISFWGGVGVIGSSKIVIEQGGWRVLLDMGLDFSPGSGLFRGPVHPRDGHVLRDRLRIGGAPAIAHLFRSDALASTGLAGGTDGKTALFITHAHIDHIGLTGWVDPAIPIYASPDTKRIMDALAVAGESVEGGIPTLLPMEDHQAVSFGPFRITRYPVDHDVIGASGYAVETEDGIVAFTGDIRLHGRHPEKSLQFASKVRGARALVIEGTTLSFGFRSFQPSEWDVDTKWQEILSATPGLVLLSMYPRNIERVAAFLDIATKNGRQLLWPNSTATFLEHMGLPGIERLDSVPLDDIERHADRYVIQLAVDNLPLLLDLPVGPGSVYVHANGEPLGPFDPSWDILQDWLKHTHTPFWSIGTGGHASPDDLNLLVETIAPEILFPLHSQEPDRLIPPPGTVRWLPQRGGRRYSLAGR